MQEKSLMTQLQSAYPNKFHDQFSFFFFCTNFVPLHLKETTQSITQIVRISSCHILHYHQTSMATPKDTNDHFSAKNTKFSGKKFIRPNSRETRRFDQIMTIFPRNSPDKNLFAHITTKSIDLTKLHEFRVFSGFKAPFPCPLR